VRGNYAHAMYLDDHPPIAGGRELWGFPKKLASPTLEVESDTLVGTLDYGKVRIATATMGFKHRLLEAAPILESLAAPNFLLKIIPHVDGSVRICELVRYYTTQVTLLGAWSAPGSLELHPHALAPVADLPVLEVQSALHFVVHLTLALGEVVYDYLAAPPPNRRAHRSPGRAPPRAVRSLARQELGFVPARGLRPSRGRGAHGQANPLDAAPRSGERSLPAVDGGVGGAGPVDDAPRLVHLGRGSMGDDEEFV